jgi:hypothetical protein
MEDRVEDPRVREPFVEDPLEDWAADWAED